MDLVEVGLKRGKTRHFIDAEKYSSVSRSKALCGMIGKRLIHYDAVFFNYKLCYPKMCPECKKLSTKGVSHYDD